jgi:hypothetical protein
MSLPYPTKRKKKSEKALEAGKSSNAFCMPRGGCFLEKAKFRHPARSLWHVEQLGWGQIIESEWWLLLQG